MSNFNTLALSLLAFFALSACSQMGDGFTNATDEGGLYALPESLNLQESGLDDWTMVNGYSVEVKAAGLGTEDTPIPACNCVETALAIENPDSVEMIYAQVVVKGRATPKTKLPDDVTVLTGSQTKTWQTGELTQSFVHPQGGALLTDGGQVYEGIFDGAATITARVDGVHTDAYYQPRAFIIHIFRKAETTVSVGMTPNYYVFHDAATETFILPEGGADREVTVSFAVSELENDNRTVILSAKAGDTTVSSGPIATPDDDEILVKTLSLSVPAGVTEVAATVTSPTRGGDSVYWNSVDLTFATEPKPEAAPGRFTGGGHVMSDGVHYSFGLTLHCDIELSNNLEINWGKGRNSNKWHLKKESLTDVLCSDDPDIAQRPPRAPLDTMTADAVGKLTFGEYKNADGSPIRFTIVDAGEPGKKDSIAVVIWEPGADPNEDEPLVSFSGNLKGGNLQAHYDQPHGNKP